MFKVDVSDGKYGVVVHDDGRMEAERYGEPWRRDLVGDNLVHAMAWRIHELEAQLAGRPDVAEMVNRFLGWKLPKEFSPDCGITFKPLGHPNGWPSGTNLLHAGQAKEMFEYCLAAKVPA